MIDYLEEEHELDVLKDLFEYLDLEKPTTGQMYTLYGVFKKDIIDYPIYINDTKVAYDSKKSRHPIFKGKPIGFEHICTRESKYSKKRNFDPERANKIHWIKPIIHFKENTRVRCFERIHGNGKNQYFYWLHEKDYVVIIREINDSLQLITAFKVDHIERRKFQIWYNEYQN